MCSGLFFGFWGRGKSAGNILHSIKLSRSMSSSSACCTLGPSAAWGSSWWWMTPWSLLAQWYPARCQWRLNTAACHGLAFSILCNFSSYVDGAYYNKYFFLVPTLPRMCLYISGELLFLLTLYSLFVLMYFWRLSSGRLVLSLSGSFLNMFSWLFPIVFEYFLQEIFSSKTSVTLHIFFLSLSLSAPTQHHPYDSFSGNW